MFPNRPPLFCLLRNVADTKPDRFVLAVTEGRVLEGGDRLIAWSVTWGQVLHGWHVQSCILRYQHVTSNTTNTQSDHYSHCWHVSSTAHEVPLLTKWRMQFRKRSALIIMGVFSCSLLSCSVDLTGSHAKIKDKTWGITSFVLNLYSNMKVSIHSYVYVIHFTVCFCDMLPW